MAKLKGLGKGLGALLSASNVALESMVDEDTKLQEIPVSNIRPGKYQPRKQFNDGDLQELADSIAHTGVIQPIVVRKISDYYELIAGERRLRASKMAGLDKIPAIIRNISDKEASAIALIENIQRKDLNIIEEAYGYKCLIDEFELTHENLAKITGRSRSHISNILRLLNLVPEVQQMLIEGKLDMGHARALLPISVQSQVDIANRVIAEGLTTMQVEQYVASLLAKQEGKLIGAASNLMKHCLDPNVIRLESDLSDKLGMLVNIKHSRNGSGKLTFTYSSLDELDNLLRYLK